MMSPAEIILLAWSSFIFWVLGQIWLAQIVVYPLFTKVGEAEYVGYHSFYTSRIPLPVILPGFASFILPVALAFLGPAIPLWMTVANIAGSGIEQKRDRDKRTWPTHDAHQKEGRLSRAKRFG